MTESDVWAADTAHTFTLTSTKVEIAITLCEKDAFTTENPWEASGSDELADISGANGGGKDGAAAAGEDIVPGPHPGASYMGIYDLSTNALTGDSVTASGSGYLTTGVGDDDVTNDASLTFSTAESYEPPIANAGPDKSAAAGSEVQFAGSSSTTGSTGEIASYDWDFESDGGWDDDGIDVTHKFSTPGTYEVTLRVVDNLGGWSVDTCMVTVTGGKGTAGGDEGGSTPGFGAIAPLAAAAALVMLRKRR